MITATALELRAGPRLLLERRDLPDRAGDRVGLVGRNGAGKTTLTRVLAGEGQPAAGDGHPAGEVGYLPQDPRTGDLDVLARDRILSARGLDAVVAPDAPDRGRDGQRRRRTTHDRAMAPLRPAGGGVPGRGRLRRRERGRGHRLQPRPARAGARPAAAARCPAVSAGASSWPGSCSPARAEDPAARRADQPPRRRLDRLAARLPAGVQGRARGHQPRRRAARARRQPGVPPRREPRRARRLQRRLEGLPAAARDRRAAPQARARQRGEEGRRADGAGRQDARQGDEGEGRAEHGQAGRAAAGRAGGGAPRTTRSPSCGSRTRRRAARRR